MIRQTLKEWVTRLRFLAVGKTRADVDQELRFHLERQIEANVAGGMTPREARRRAMIAFGGLQRAREECREERPGYWLETLLQDIRYAIRGFRRNPAFTVTVILTLTLGIGATTAVFSVVDRILFRSLPYAHDDRLVSVGLIAPIMADEFMLGGSYYEWRDHQKPFESLTSEVGGSPCDLTEVNPERLSCVSVESSFLPTLGVAPVVGRNFTGEEDRPGAPKVALISYSLWSSRFHRNSGFLDKLISIDGEPVRVIGVLPAEFEMPRLQPVDIMMPQALDEAAQRRADPGRPMWAFARLKPGVSGEQAKAELEPLFQYSLRLAPAQFRKEVHLQVRSLRDRQVHDVRLVAWVLFGVVLAVLLIACANVASLLLARGAARERELAVRSALGAGRFRLVRQALTESLLLSLAGAAVGGAFAAGLLRAFVAVAPEGLVFLSRSQVDLRILLFTLLISLLCGALFGLAPALQTPRPAALGSRTSMAGKAAVRQGLVVTQIAASMVLLAAGTLLFRSFVNLQSQSLGMTAERVVTAKITLGWSGYATGERQMDFFQRLQRELRYGPGVTALAISDSLPPGGDHRDQIFASLSIDGKPKPTGATGGLVAWRWVTPGYFQALGIPIVRGRGFTEEELDSTNRFVVLSKQLAARMFAGDDPIGQRIYLSNAAGGPQANPPYTVVGVAADVKNGGLAGGDEPEYYRLRRTAPADWDRNAVIVLKTSLPVDAVEEWLRSQIAALDPTVPVEIATLSESVHRFADMPRFETMLVGCFAATGVLLAVIGLYGVISFLAVQRTQEIGLRMALGATRTNVLRLILGSGLRLIVPGVALGLFAALTVSRILSTLLFGIGPRDPVTFAWATILLSLVALFATMVPAAAATAVNPSEALRRE
jgi:predicted permease